MKILPPGTILQLMYLKERLKKLQAGYFVEIGPGNGEITKILLDLKWSWSSYDLDAITIENLKNRFQKEIDEKRYIPIHENYLNAIPNKSPNLIISSMVMEHLNDTEESQFMNNSYNILKKDGLLISLVPSSPSHWGIEDDIAGHYRRYNIESVRKLAKKNKWELQHIAGLTYPISNILLPISNFLVKKNEANKLSLTMLDRTKLSGRRSVFLKTTFPSLFKIFCNFFVLYPLHILQKMFSKSNNALILYFEARPQKYKFY